MAQEFEEGEYTVSVIGKNIEITKPIRDYIDEKITKIEKITNQIIEVDVRLDVQKLNHTVDIIIKFSHSFHPFGIVSDSKEKSTHQLLSNRLILFIFIPFSIP